jgi:hypothetical protein
MRILVQGDSHGNLNDIIPKLYTAGEYKINHVMVVGDFGLWTHERDGHLFLDEVNEAARINNLNVYAIGGNHENWDHWEWACANLPKVKGFAAIRSRVLLAPKVHSWTWAGKKFAGAGGAVSVDKEARLMSERGDPQYYQDWMELPRKKGPRTEWWPNEEFTDEHVAQFKREVDEVDYLFTHDCSNYTPWKGRLKPDIDSEIHRKRIDEVIYHCKPFYHFHGHMHEQYDWLNSQALGYYSPREARLDGTEPVRTIGLEAFKRFNSWGVLEVEKGEWLWPSQFYKAIQERADRKAARINDQPEVEYEIIKSSTE